MEEKRREREKERERERGSLVMMGQRDGMKAGLMKNQKLLMRRIIVFALGGMPPSKLEVKG